MYIHTDLKTNTIEKKFWVKHMKLELYCISVQKCNITSIKIISNINTFHLYNILSIRSRIVFYNMF